ncbi:MAG: hypothetical protein KA201_19690 [Kofleriaceae bacterium]|nr:hypothetical protein [Kofleriaceae bacterium]
MAARHQEDALRQVWFVAATVAALGGCKKKDEAPPPPPPPADAAPIAVDAPPIAVDAGDPEAAARQGKRTGLGTPDEVPEVVVEALVAAIAEGKLPAARFVDPAEGYLEHIIMPGAMEKPDPDVIKRHCGAKAAARFADDARTLLREQAEGTKDPAYVDHELICSNEFLAAADPTFGARPDPAGGDTPVGGTPWRYALCRSGGAGEYDANYELLFAPDATRGVRVVGMLTWEGGMNPAAVWPDFARDALKVGACKK